jgi:hypothetical protein
MYDIVVRFIHRTLGDKLFMWNPILY